MCIITQNICSPKLLLGCCLLPTVTTTTTIENSSVCSVEGSYITYYCQPGLMPNEKKKAYCLRNGSWNPNPSDLACDLSAEDSSPGLSNLCTCIINIAYDPYMETSLSRHLMAMVIKLNFTTLISDPHRCFKCWNCYPYTQHITGSIICVYVLWWFCVGNSVY